MDVTGGFLDDANDKDEEEPCDGKAGVILILFGTVEMTRLCRTLGARWGGSGEGGCSNDVAWDAMAVAYLFQEFKLLSLSDPCPSLGQC